MKRIFVGGTGMITPIGIGREMVYHSLRAGINRYRECTIIGSEDDAAKVATVPDDALKAAINPSALTGAFSAREERLLRLATAALSTLTPALPSVTLPLFLAAPEPYPGTATITHNFIDNLAIQSGVSIDTACSRIIYQGRAGGITAMDTAFKYFASIDQDYALVGGVDSFYDREILQLLDDASRLLTFSSTDGFAPGEGAGFLLLISPHAAADIRRKAQACIERPGIAHEKGHRLSTTPSRGDGLSMALAQALACGCPPIDRIYNSENGERHYAKESQMALTRHRQSFSDTFQIYRPAEYCGDLGAAFGPIAVGLASVSFEGKSGDNNENAALICSASDFGARTALCVTPVPDMDDMDGESGRTDTNQKS